MKKNSRNVIIVGASSSIGDAIVKNFYKNGDNIIATFNKNKPDSEYPSVNYEKLDLGSKSSIKNFAKSKIEGLGRIDIIILLPSILPGKSLDEYDNNLIDEVININFTSQVLLFKYLFNSLNKKSNILFISSISSMRGSYDPIYAASKSAINGFVKSLAKWAAPHSRVNAIAPSLIKNSSMYFEMDPDRREIHISESPSKNLISIDHLADIIFELCDSKWSNLNGQIINVNGGSYV
tara:strand:+ start:554 stop:1261 length:708 start_codon:yes stop_codon:yes gene_type:complete